MLTRADSKLTRVDYALSNYPLSTEFRREFERRIERQPNYIGAAELRRLSVPQALGRLRSLRADKLCICIEDESGLPITSPMILLAAISDAKRLEIVYPDFRREHISRWAAVPSLFGIARTSWRIRRSAAECRLEVRRLIEQPRIIPSIFQSNRVLYLNGNLWFGVRAGGSVGHIAGIVNGLLKDGWNVDFATTGSSDLIRTGAGRIKLLAPKNYGLPYDYNYYHFTRLICAQLQSIVQEREYAFLYQRMSIANYAGVILSRRAGIPLVLEYNGSETWVARNWGRRLRNENLGILVENVCLRHAHLIVTVSEVLRDELIDSRSVPPDRIATYPNCIDPERFDPNRCSDDVVEDIRRKFKVDRDAVVVSFLGTFGQWHGAEVLAQAFQKMIETERSWLAKRKVHCFFIGDGLRLPAVKQILRHHTCDEFCHFVGLVPQLEAPAYLAASDIVVSPHVPNADGSRFFGSPTKLFEYMAMRKAIIASDLDQISHVLRNSLRAEALPTALPRGNESLLAVLFRPGNIDELIQSIRFLTEYPQWRQSLGANARREALANYTWSRHVAVIQAHLESLQLITQPNRVIVNQ
jgi:glycosyltransferase involved in cell wall biosynthesis